MANLDWKQAISGDWSTAAAWSGDLAPSALDDVFVGLIGNYVVTIAGAATARSLTFDAPGATLVQEAGGSLALSGALTVNNGLVTLAGANTIGLGVFLNGGVIAIGDGAALGDAELAMSGGMLLGTADLALVNALEMSGAITIAAAEGTTLDLGGTSGWSVAAGTTVEFGADGHDGTVVWHTQASSSIGNDVAIKVRAGTLRAGDDRLYLLTDFLPPRPPSMPEPPLTLPAIGPSSAICRAKASSPTAAAPGPSSCSRAPISPAPSAAPCRSAWPPPM